MKQLALILVSLIVGGVVGAGGMLVAYPFIFTMPPVNETVQLANSTAENCDEANTQTLGTTKFRTDSKGQDPIHWGRGNIKFYRSGNGKVLVELQSDFEVGPGPNFWIYLNNRGNIEDEDDFLGDKKRVRAHKLKSFTGSQVYEFNEADFEKAGAITIWCDTFNQYIASADLPK